MRNDSCSSPRRSPRALAGCAVTQTEPPQLDLPPASADRGADDALLERWWTAFDDPALDRARRRGARATTSTSRRRSRASSSRARRCCSRSRTCTRTSTSPSARRASRIAAVDVAAAARRARRVVSNDFSRRPRAVATSSTCGASTAAARSPRTQRPARGAQYYRETVRTTVAADVAQRLLPAARRRRASSSCWRTR